ncbi:MAG TPA: type I restriction-modification system subunit M [Bacteroidales bacterium]|nr:type I restriction-modification system subunit M [Bacteroidales bacterium]
MAIKKSELYSTLWKSCDELRGGMDASQYKDYVLVMLFVKYVSDKAKTDKKYLLVIPERCSFDDFIELKGKEKIGEQINIKISALAEANGLTGVINLADFSDETKLGKGKDLIETVSNLISVFQNSKLDFGSNRASDDDLMGDAYEYLMKNFAQESGKSKGQFYTPSEVSRLMAKVIGLEKSNDVKDTIYDPTCGSGSLLLRALAETKKGASIYGQEKDVATAGLAKMNMILHGHLTPDILQGDTLNNPLHLENGDLKTFDYIVANPPFSTKSWLKSAKQEDEHKRWGGEIGLPPEKNGDYAFLLHIIRSLNFKGQGACILPHGVLFRGNSEEIIRRNIINKGYIKGIIGLPSNLFYGTGIPACIIILDKQGAGNRKGIYIIDAKEGFVKDGNKNRLREEDIQRIVDAWNSHKDIPYFARFVHIDEIKKNEYNLNIPRYIAPKDKEVIHDIKAHLQGGLPLRDIEELKQYWMACPNMKDDLFIEQKDNKGYFDLKCSKEEIRDIIWNHEDFANQKEIYSNHFKNWVNNVFERLESIDSETKPKLLISDISIDLLYEYQNGESLVDAYDIYDHLMNYWNGVMQDDVYIVMQDGWKAELYVPQPQAQKGKTPKEKVASSVKDLMCDLLHVEIVVNEFFGELNNKILLKEEEIAKKESDIMDLMENEENIQFFDESNFKDDKINDANIKKRIKELDKNKDKEEIEALKNYLKLKNDISNINKEIKNLNTELLNEVENKYATLTENDIKYLVLDNKWVRTLENNLQSLLQSVTQNLTTNIIDLAERYETPLPAITNKVIDLEEKVKANLQKMGYKWN